MNVCRLLWFLTWCPSLSMQSNDLYTKHRHGFIAINFVCPHLNEECSGPTYQIHLQFSFWTFEIHNYDYVLFDFRVDAFYSGQRLLLYDTLPWMQRIKNSSGQCDSLCHTCTLFIHWNDKGISRFTQLSDTKKCINLIVWIAYEFPEWIQCAPLKRSLYKKNCGTKVPDVRSVTPFEDYFAKMHNDARRTWINISFLRAFALIAVKLPQWFHWNAWVFPFLFS